MEYLIDGYNVIKSSYLGKYGESRSKVEFYQLLFRYKSKHPAVNFTVVLDGFKPADFILVRDRRIKTVFSGEITADEYIRKRVEKGRDNSQVVVVSDDKQVRISGKIFGCRVISVNEFMELISPFKTGQKKTGEDTFIKTLDYRKRRKIEEELKSYYGKKK